MNYDPSAMRSATVVNNTHEFIIYKAKARPGCPVVPATACSFCNIASSSKANSRTLDGRKALPSSSATGLHTPAARAFQERVKARSTGSRGIHRGGHAPISSCVAYTILTLQCRI